MPLKLCCYIFFLWQELFTGAGRTLEMMEPKEIEQLLGTIIDVSTVNTLGGVSNGSNPVQNQPDSDPAFL